MITTNGNLTLNKMSKQKKKKVTQVKRRQMIEEVFKKGKKQREIAKKFDEKLSRKQPGTSDKNKFQLQKKVVSIAMPISIADSTSKLKLD